MDALGTVTANGTPKEIIPARARRELRITVKSGGPVAFAYGDEANKLTFENGDEVPEGISVTEDNPRIASGAVWAVTGGGDAQVSFEMFF